MSSCIECGDRWPSDQTHECWVRVKLATQNRMPASWPTDVAMLGRPIETDADWYTNHGHGD